MLTSSLPPFIAIHCTDQSISISCIPSLLSSISSWTRNKARSLYVFLQPTHQSTLQLPTGPGRLIFLRRSVSNWPPWSPQTKRGLPNSPFLSFTTPLHPHPHSTSTGPENQWKGFEEGEHPLPVSVVPLVPPYPLKKKNRSAKAVRVALPSPRLCRLLCSLLHIPQNFSLNATPSSCSKSSEWKTDLLKNVVFSSFLFLSEWAIGNVPGFVARINGATSWQFGRGDGHF